MKVTQISTLVNNMFSEEVDGASVLLEDLSNVVEFSKAHDVFSLGYDKLYSKLIDQISAIIMEDRVYSKNVPDIYRSSYEFGCVVEKIRVEMPTANENPSWSLTNGTDYSPDVFTTATVTAKFYTGKTTFEITVPSITDYQIKSAFQSAGQLSAFVSMIHDACKVALTERIDALVMRVINSMIAETVFDEFKTSGSATATTSGEASSTKAINLLWEYNENYRDGTAKPYLSVDDALTDREFLRYANYRIKQIAERVQSLTTMFNVGGKKTFTPSDKMRVALHTDFVAGSECYMKADIYHEGYVPIPNATIVPFWQGTGSSFAFDDTSKIYVKTSNTTDVTSGGTTVATNHTVTCYGVVGVIFDYEACGVSNTANRMTSHYNARAEFTNAWMKADAGYWNDLDYNCVVFYMYDTDHTN